MKRWGHAQINVFCIVDNLLYKKQFLLRRGNKASADLPGDFQRKEIKFLVSKRLSSLKR